MNTINQKVKVMLAGLALLAANQGVVLATPAAEVISSKTQTDSSVPNLWGYVSRGNLNLCLFEMKEGRKFLEIRRTHWFSTKPAKTETRYEYTLMEKISETSEGITYRGFQIDQDKKLKLSERIIDLTITKNGNSYIGVLMVNGENESGWEGYFEMEAH